MHAEKKWRGFLLKPSENHLRILMPDTGLGKYLFASFVKIITLKYTDITSPDTINSRRQCYV